MIRVGVCLFGGPQLRQNVSEFSTERDVLGSYFTNTVLQNTSMASKAFETHLWTRMTLSQDLHSVAMFLGSTQVWIPPVVALLSQI